MILANLLLGLAPTTTDAIGAGIRFNLGVDDQVVPQLKSAMAEEVDGTSLGLLVVEAQEVALPGNGATAVAAAALIEGMRGMRLPTVTAVAPFQGNARVGAFDLAQLRHDDARRIRDEFPERGVATATANGGWLVIDGAGRFSPELKAAVANWLGVEDGEVRVVPLGMPAFRDLAKPWRSAAKTPHGVDLPPTSTLERIRALLQEGVLTRMDLESGRVIYNPVGMGTAAVADAAVIYGVGESWPQVIRQAGPPAFALAEIVPVHELRQATAPVAISRELLSRVLDALPEGSQERDELAALLG